MASAPKLQRYFVDDTGCLFPSNRDESDETGDVFVYTAEDVEAVFQPGVAYMPVPRCDSCRFWGRDAVGQPHGAIYNNSTCEHPRDLLTRDGAPHESGNIWTAPDFGCVQHEPKET